MTSSSPSVNKTKSPSLNEQFMVKKVIDFNEFDNSTTLLYKLSDFLSHNKKIGSQPIEFISLQGDNIDNYIYSVAKFDYIIRFDPANDTLTLVDEYKSILAKFSDLDYNDIAMLYKSTMDHYRSKGIEYINNNDIDLTLDANILIAINDMYKDIMGAEISTAVEFVDIDVLESEYEHWLIEKDKKAVEQHEIYEKLVNVQNELFDIDVLDYSELVIETVYYTFLPQIKHIYATSEIQETYVPSIEEGIEIFKHAKTSANVPFIQYIDNDGKYYYWVYDNTFEDSYVKSPSIYLNFMKQQTRFSSSLPVPCIVMYQMKQNRCGSARQMKAVQLVLVMH